MSVKSEFQKLRTEDGRHELKDKWKRKIQSGKRWVIDNKEMVIALTPVIVTGLATITKVVGRVIVKGKEKDLKELYCYDRSLGHYWRLKRDLSNREWLAIDTRKANGERLADILADMKVLK